MRLIITRHGETIENREGILQGHMPGRLSKLGLEQAKKTAHRLSNEKIDYIYSSDLARSADTAKEIAKFHPEIPLIFTEELRERNLGELQGKRKQEVEWEQNVEEYNTPNARPKNGESLTELRERGRKFLLKILKKHIDDTVLVVAHNGINLALYCEITHRPTSDIYDLENFGSTSITEIEIGKDLDYSIKIFNCTEHLQNIY